MKLTQINFLIKILKVAEYKSRKLSGYNTEGFDYW